MSGIPKPLKHFFFSGLKKGILTELEDAGLDFGKILSVNFICSPAQTGSLVTVKSDTKIVATKVIQRVIFEKKENADTTLDNKDKLNFQSTLGIDLDNEMKGFKSIFCKLDFDTKNIIIQKTPFEGEVQKTVL